MKKCEKCGAENSDDAKFCGSCGENFDGEKTISFLPIITERIIRLLSLLDINHNDAPVGTPVTEDPSIIVNLMYLVLSIDRNLSENELSNINTAINHLEKQFYESKKGNELYKGFFYNFTDKTYETPSIPSVEFEDERFEIITEAVFRPILEKRLFKSTKDVEAVIILIGLLCACDGNFSRTKERVFEKIRRMDIIRKFIVYKLEDLSLESLHIFAKSLQNEFRYNYRWYDSVDEIEDKGYLLDNIPEDLKCIEIVANNKIKFVNGEEIKTSNEIQEFLKEIGRPITEKIDSIIELSKKLCEIEQGIYELEKSTDCSYLEIKNAILDKINEEENLLKNFLTSTNTNNIETISEEK